MMDGADYEYEKSVRMEQAMTHDPLLDAWLVEIDDEPNYSDYLTLIARVREDERSGAPENWNRAFYEQGYATALRDAVEAVKALCDCVKLNGKHASFCAFQDVPAKDQHDDDGLISLCFDKGEAVDAITALGGER